MHANEHIDCDGTVKAHDGEWGWDPCPCKCHPARTGQVIPEAGGEVTAAEKAMADVEALLDEYFSDSSRIVEVDVVMRTARIVGAYSVERIGEGK